MPDDVFYYVEKKDDTGTYQPYGILSYREAFRISFREHRAVRLVKVGDTDG